ncbi:FAD-dependent oxidoreductase [Dokdonella sp.]|uniref:NAD(P)/FAD-dependent oxidoreductase n=1 Tax=Dokdonella sp. TaxID=2291710 RepID=UPI00260AD2DF|nr:FAD-dependent oxidoreductase [Dokdonella sp.]
MTVTRHDLIVVGAGLVGAACVEAATAAGLRVAVVESGAIGGGATSAAMGHLVAMDGDAAELALCTHSLRLWPRWAAWPESEFQPCGTLWIARSEVERAQIPARVDALAGAGVPAKAVGTRALYDLEPHLAPGLLGGFRVPGDAVVYPPRVAWRLIAEACRDGAELHAGVRAERLVDDGVRLDNGRTLRGPVLVATGAALPELLPELPMRPRKGQLVITDRYPPLVRHQLIEMGYAAAAHGADDASVSFNVQPRPNGQLLIGSSREYGNTDASVSPPLLGRMLRRAFDFVPALRELRAIRAWSGFRPATPDGLPYLGAVPGRHGVWVAAGHEGLGITAAPGSASLVVDAFLGRTPALDLAPYRPGRALREAA